MEKLINTINWKRFDTLFISEKLMSSKFSMYKGRVIALVHLFMLVVVVSTQLLTFLTPENSIGYILPTCITISLPIIFKKYGNLNLSGNLLAFGIATILVPMIAESGGLYSDNLLWLILCPLVVMLFVNKEQVLLWQAGFVLFTAYQYYVFEDTQTTKDFNHHDPTYYFISIALLSTVIVIVIYLFKKGEEDIIANLNRQRIELEFQKNALSDANRQLREISQQLRASNSDLESFAYAASHDLKEPLRMIGSYTQLIQRRLEKVLTPDTTEMMFFVKDGVFRMQKLLDDVLEYSRAGRGKDKMIEVDLDDVFYYIKTALRLQFEEKNAQIHIPEPLPPVYAQYSAMVQVFQNLTSNALKFTNENTPPVLTVTWEDRDEQFVTIYFSDNGIGIAEEYQEKVFNLFERLHYRENYTGSGIGLSTCKKIIENMGGAIHLTSVEGEGTTFHISLPKSEHAYQNIFSMELHER